MRGVLTLAGAVFVLWFAFFQLGVWLVRIPPDVHDGTLWKRLSGTIDEGGTDGPES